MFEKPLQINSAGLGFEDCSAKAFSVEDKQFASSHTFLAQHEEVGPKAWNFYAFNVTPEDYQVVVNFAEGTEESPDACEPLLSYLRKSSCPFSNVMEKRSRKRVPYHSQAASVTGQMLWKQGREPLVYA